MMSPWVRSSAGCAISNRFLTDVSFVDPADGIRFRGMSIPELLKKLPKARGGKMPLVGGLYYLLMIGEVPTKEQAHGSGSRMGKARQCS